MPSAPACLVSGLSDTRALSPDEPVRQDAASCFTETEAEYHTRESTNLPPC